MRYERNGKNMSGISGVTSLLTAFFVTALSGIFLVPFLRKLKFGQTTKDIGPVWHAKKNGTPTMGGILFIIGIIFGVIVGTFILYGFSDPSAVAFEIGGGIALWAGVLMAIGFGFIGFIDDYIKVVKKRNLGLTAMQKSVAQFVVAIAYIATLSLNGVITTIVTIPFIGQWDLGWFYYLIAVLGIYFIVNAVNLTDGIDGLASSVTAVYAIIFMIICSALYSYSMGLFAAAVTGGCLGFLVWNFYPAKVFMGDTGSLFLGGAVVALAFGVNQPILIFLAGIVYICEAFSVVLQVISFKTTGKRIFKMSPIHHHFEMCNWSEIKIVTVFSFVGAVFGVFAILCLVFGIL